MDVETVERLYNATNVITNDEEGISWEDL